ncbi:juvenile hormone esterase-like isoform X1 [Cherax quadricarinatus]
MTAAVLQVRMQHLAVCALMVMAAGCESLRAGRCASHGPAVVTTTQGKVAGIMEKSTKGKSFWSYYGIPYAKPPIGQLRLRDPLPAEPWGGLRNGSEVSQPCLQVPFFVAVAGIRLPPQQLVGTEDCLYLNVFTPTQLTSIKELPVMVFIPGGGFFAGGNLEYLPHVLLNHDIILVVLQYRLGILGFLSTEDYIVPGNLGLKDQTLALQWVQNNIHSFGGDPNSVTIFGESAGGASVHYHILSPKSRGLFSRAILQSGSALATFALGRRHREIAEQVGSSLGCDTSLGSTHLLACLQTIDAHELSATLQDFLEWSITPLPLGPRVDGDFIPAHPALLIRDHQYNPVDILTGTTAHEGLLVGYPLFGQTNLQESLLKNFSYVGPLSLMCCDGSTDPLTITQRVYTYYLGGLNFSLETQKDQIIRVCIFLSLYCALLRSTVSVCVTISRIFLICEVITGTLIQWHNRNNRNKLIIILYN